MVDNLILKRIYLPNSRFFKVNLQNLDFNVKQLEIKNSNSISFVRKIVIEEISTEEKFLNILRLLSPFIVEVEFKDI